jgi:hypothetical protein
VRYGSTEQGNLKSCHSRLVLVRPGTHGVGKAADQLAGVGACEMPLREINVPGTMEGPNRAVRISVFCTELGGASRATGEIVPSGCSITHWNAVVPSALTGATPGARQAAAATTTDVGWEGVPAVTSECHSTVPDST